MDEADVTVPLIFGLGCGKSGVKGEVMADLRETFEKVLVENLLNRTGSIPVADFASAVTVFQKTG
jgi:hypothetical protein